MTSDERPEEGVYTWRWDKLSYEVLVLGDGVVIAGAFLNGEILRIWDEPEGAA